MHATHPYLHPRRALVTAIAVLALMLLALMPTALDGASFSIGGGDRPAAEAPGSSTTQPQGGSAWLDNPFAYPLLQIPVDRAR